MLKPYSTSNMHSLRSEERPGRKLEDFWSAQWPQGGPSREKKTKKKRKRRETTENLAKKNEDKGKTKTKNKNKSSDLTRLWARGPANFTDGTIGKIRFCFVAICVVHS